MKFLVPGNSLGRDLDEEEDYGLVATPSATTMSDTHVPAIIPSLSPLPCDPREFAIDDPPRSEAEEVALYQSVMHEEAVANKTVEESQDEEPELSAWRPEKSPPAGLFRASILPFLFNHELLVRMGFLATAIFFSLFVLSKAFAFMSVPNMGIASFGAWFGGMLFLALGGMMSIVCLIYAAALAMSILVDTSNGLKQIESWPRGFFFDWLHEAGYLVGAAFWSELPGIPFSLIPDPSRLLSPLVSTAIAAILFPIVLIAELDAGLFFFPGSPAVWMSPLRSRRAWMDFYLVTTPPLIFAVGSAAYAFQANIAWMMFVSSVLVAAAWLLYFRLLGRLAWYISGKAEASE